MRHMSTRPGVVSVFIALALLLAACAPAIAPGQPGSGLSATATRPAAATAAPTEVAAATATSAPEGGTPEAEAAGCSVVYSDGKELFCQQSFAVRLSIATADRLIVQPRLSPDGLLVAFAVVNGDQSALWLARTDGSGVVAQIGPDELSAAGAKGAVTPYRWEWRAGSQRLYFNTRPASDSQFDPNMLPNADLWSSDAASGALEQVVDRAGAGRFALSPDGRRAVLALPAALELLDLETGERQAVLEYAAIDNDTPTGYLPRADWGGDGTFFNVAIPSNPALSVDGTAVLYRVSADGALSELGGLRGSLTAGGPIEFEFSPDGAWVAYGTFDVSTLESALHLAKSDGTGDRVVETFDRGHGFIGLAWSPDSAHYLYEALSLGGRIAALDGTSETFADGMEVMDGKWIAADSFAYYAVTNSDAGLYLYRPNEPMRVVVGGLLGGPVFDVLAEPVPGD